MTYYPVRNLAERGDRQPENTRPSSPSNRLVYSSLGAISLAWLSFACSGEPSNPNPSGTTTSTATTNGDGDDTAGQTTSGTSNGTTSSNTSGDGDGDVAPVCTADLIYTGRSPIRRLTRFEYNKTVEALLDDTTSPGNSLPPELVGNGFGNDADEQPISSFLAEQYGIIAGQAATRALDNASFMTKHAPCYSTVNEGTEESCSRTFIESFVTSAYRRPLLSTEVDELVQLQKDVQAISDYKTSLSTVIEAVLQSPDFLYRVELGDPATEADGRLRLTGHEMASRLSFFFWGAPPDEQLIAAAESGQLNTNEQVLVQAMRLLDDMKARPVILNFFSKFLPIEGLTDLARDGEEFPSFSPKIGSLMRKETEAFLQYEIFDGPGDWKSILTASYTFVNEDLAKFYGIEGVTGTDFVKANVDPSHRMGLLTHGSILTGTTVTNYTNPVRRGAYLLRDVMCLKLPSPPEGLSVSPPEPSSGLTGRERFTAHSQEALCRECHSVMDPPGFAFENFNAVGLWRDQENGVTIDASGTIEALPEPFTGPLDLIRIVAEDAQTHACFAQKWFTYAVGRQLDLQDSCLLEKLATDFAASGYNVKDLLLQITQTDAFIYLPAQETL